MQNTQDKTSQKVMMKKQKQFCRDMSVTFNHENFGEIRLTITTSGCVIIHEAKSMFTRKENIERIEVYTNDSGDEYMDLNFKSNS